MQVVEQVCTTINTRYGPFTAHLFESEISTEEILVMSMGDLRNSLPLLLRIQSACLTSEAFHSEDCDCHQQLDAAMQEIASRARGLIVYLCDQEGRGNGLKAKLKSMEHASIRGITTYQAYQELGFPEDNRQYGAVVSVLRKLELADKIELLSENPDKAAFLRDAGFDVVVRTSGNALTQTLSPSIKDGRDG